MKEVAQRAGVSTATVSRVVNHPNKVDSTTRDAVQKVIDEMDYRPNSVARVLVRQSSNTIGVVINRFSSSYYGHMLDGVERALFDVGFKTIAESSRETGSGELRAIDSLLDRQCDGIVLHSDRLTDTQVIGLLEKHPQIMLMNRLIPGFASRCVYVDNVHGGTLAASYLYEMGHRKVVLVTGPRAFFESTDRYKGFRKEWEKNGLSLNDAEVVEGDFTVESGRTSMLRILDENIDATAVFFMSDEMAVGALEVCRDRGVRVPDQISVLGFDDMNIASLVYPRLTTIKQPLGGIGEAAGALAHAIATGGDQEKCKKVFNARLIERDSVRRADG